MHQRTEVEVLPLGGLEGTFTTRDQIDAVLASIPTAELYAIFCTAGEIEEAYWPSGEYGLIFIREENGLSAPVTVRVSGGKIVRIDTSVPQDPADLLEQLPAENVILQPGDAAAWV